MDRASALLPLLACLLLASPAKAQSPPLPERGARAPGLEPFDELMRSFLKTHGVPGGALCVARGQRVLYSRAFGWADLKTRTPVKPTSLFRIASISKPITAVAVLRLVREGRLRLKQNPFRLLGWRGELKRAADPRLAAVSVLHLLQHRAGFDRSKSGDVMFMGREVARTLKRRYPPSVKDYSRFLLRRRLDFAPGARQVYSNVGYSLLGRVIEKASGLSYERYVKEKVLKPWGVRDLRLGRSLPKGRWPKEVRYYASGGKQSVRPARGGALAPRAYAHDHEVLDAHGGWVGSALDLVRFGVGVSRAKPVLTPADRARMFARPPGMAPGPVYYAMGWSVRDVAAGKRNTWHTGLLPGTSTLLVRRADGLTWAVLFNADRSQQAPRQVLSALIDPLVHKAADRVRRWPR